MFAFLSVCHYKNHVVYRNCERLSYIETVNREATNTGNPVTHADEETETFGVYTWSAKIFVLRLCSVAASQLDHGFLVYS